MKITFLGTGTSQGVPVIGCACPTCQSLDFRDNRLRSSIHVEVDGQSLVVDTGPDFRQQMLRERVDRLDAVLFTHAHKDHTAGMDDIRSYNFKQHREMPLYGSREVFDQLAQEFAYVFRKDKYPGIPQIEIHEIDKEPFRVGQTPVLPIEVMHFKLSVLGFRIYDFTYITDCKTIAPEEKEKIKGSRILVLNALQKEPHISHLTLQEAIDFAGEIQAENTYLTHISHNMGLHREVETELPEGVAIAYDGLVVES